MTGIGVVAVRVERGQVCGVQKVEWKGLNDFFLLDLDVVRYCFCLILQPSFLPKLGTPCCVALSRLVQGEANTPGFHSSAAESGKQGHRAAILEAAQVAQLSVPRSSITELQVGATS